jgi:hypothetical protein
MWTKQGTLLVFTTRSFWKPSMRPSFVKCIPLSALHCFTGMASVFRRVCLCLSLGFNSFLCQTLVPETGTVESTMWTVPHNNSLLIQIYHSDRQRQKHYSILLLNKKLAEKKLHGLSPRPNYTDRATAACRRSDCQLLRIEGATWSAWRISTAVFSIF